MVSNHFARYFKISLVTVTGAVLAFLFCIFLLCSLIEGAEWCLWWPHISLSGAVDLIRYSGSLGILASLGLMVIHSFVPFPAELVAIANGMVYGSFWGTVITWVGAMLGAFLAFALSRRYGRPFVHRVLSRKQALRMDDWMAQHAAGTLFISRFIPVISFNLVNYAAGLLRISWLTFAWTTGFGILPITVLMVAMGERIHSLPWLVWILFLAGGLILWVLFHLVVRRFKLFRSGI